MAKVRTPRGAWVRAALQALAAGGPDAVRVETLAASLGVSKGGFYWHFADRQALIGEMLDTWEKTGTEDIIARVESQPGDARAKLWKLLEITTSPEGLAVELAVRDWSRRDGDVAERLRRADNRRMEFIRSLFRPFCADTDDVEVRSMTAYWLVIGSYFVAADHGDKTRSQVLQLAIDRLLRLGPVPPRAVRRRRPALRDTRVIPAPSAPEDRVRFSKLRICVEYFGLPESFVHYSPQNIPLNPNTPR